MLGPQVVEPATSAAGACWSSAFFLQPGCCTHIPSSSQLLGNALSEKCRAAQMVGEECNNLFSLYIFEISFIALQLSHCPLISHCFYNRNESSREGFKEEKECVEAEGGVGKADIGDDIKKCKAKQTWALLYDVCWLD